MFQTHSVALFGRPRQSAGRCYSLFDDTLVTVWSAPNYCYRCGNVAAILTLGEKLERSFKLFNAARQDIRSMPAKRPATEFFL